MVYSLYRALVSAKSARMCERAVLTNRPSLDLSPIVLKGLESLSGSEGQIRCLPQPEQLHGLRARTEQGREWMMAQNDRVVVGIDVAKDKVDACIRSLSQRADVPEHRGGAARTDPLASRNTRSARQPWRLPAATSGTGPRRCARPASKSGSSIPKRVRSFARSAGRLAKNDAIDAEMIAWFAETFADAPGQAYDAAREKLVQIVNARQSLLDLQTSLQNRGEHSAPESRAENAGAALEDDRPRSCQA